MMETSQQKTHGINIRKYCQDHEAAVRRCLDDGGGAAALLIQHERRLRWLQHERLIHLIVTALTAVLLLFSIALFLVLCQPLILILTLIAFCLTAAYLRHYFFLENTVQRWYKLYDALEAAADKTQK